MFLEERQLMKESTKNWLWFITLWLGGLTTVASVSYGVKLILQLL